MSDSNGSEPQADKAAATRALGETSPTVTPPRPEDDVVVKTPRPEDDVVVRTPRPEDDVVHADRPDQGKPVLKVRGLCKRFGRTQAVSDIGFTLFAGDVLGLVGGNGAGKTTTLRILATVLKPDTGEFELDGFSLKQTLQIRERLGYMPDFLGVYEDLLVCEYLEFFARAYHIDEAMLDFRINEVVEFAGLKDVLQRPVEGLSRGMTQRLGLARALIHGPRLLLLDEPASGLDPRARLEFRDMVRHLQRQGKVVIVSSHILADLADMCNKIAIIDRGRLVALEETLHMINRADGDRRYKVQFMSRAEDGFKALKEWPGVREVTWDGADLVFSFDGTRQAGADLLKALVQQNFSVAGFNELPGSLERAYLNLTQGGGKQALLAPDRIVAGQYQVMRLLGEGASGRVWLVRDLKERGNRWALKELTPGGSELNARESRELVAKEIRFLRALEHPGLPRLIDVIEEHGVEYLVMERIEGFTLEQVCTNQGGRLKPADVAAWMQQAAGILDYLHSRTPPVVFRDVKPSNLMLSADGAVRLVDLGIARAFNPTRPGDTHCIGTPGYCPPEQYQGRTSPATDVYAAGATMFNLLTGLDPEKYNFKFPSISTEVPEISEAFDALVARCLLLTPADRYPDGAALKVALRDIQPVKRVPRGLLKLLQRFK